MRRVAMDGFDMTLDGRIGLTLYRDGRRPAVQGGRFGQSEAMRAAGGVEQPVILDRLDGGVGSTERLVPNTYALTIDGCTRFSRAWTPAGEISPELRLPPGLSGRPPGEIKAMIPWHDMLIVAAGGVIYMVVDLYGGTSYAYNLAVPMGEVNVDEDVEDLIEFEGVLVAGTTRYIPDQPGILGPPGRLWTCDPSTLRWGQLPTTPNVEPVLGQFLCKAYFTIDNLSQWRLVTNPTPWTFAWIATGPASPTIATDILDFDRWAGGDLYPVGDRSARITNMAGAPLIMFFCKEDGVYHVAADGRAARIADWSDSQHKNNGKVFEFAYGGLYASHVRWGLVRVDVANLQVQWQTNACAPGANLPRVLPSQGEITAFCMDGEWMVVTQWNGQDGYTFYGRPNEITERTAMINLQSPQSLNWHGSEATFWFAKPTCLKQATIGPADRPLLWVGMMQTEYTYDDVGDIASSRIYPKLVNVSLPKYGTPLEDWILRGPHRFTSESWLYYPRQDWGEERAGPYSGWASVRKVFNRLDMTGEYLKRYEVYIDVFMAVEGGHNLFSDRVLFDDRALFCERAADPMQSGWVNVGRFDEGDRTSLVPGKTIQSGLKANIMLHGRAMRDKPFALYGVKLRGTPLLEQSERRSYRVVLGRARKANQAIDHQTRWTTLNEMWALQWADPVVLIDHQGIPLVIDIDPTMSYEDVVEPNTSEPTTVVTFSCRIIRRPFVWGAGYRWGADIMWS